MNLRNEALHLAADIGGTKTVLALFTAHDGPHEPKYERRFASNDYESLPQILIEYLDGSESPILSATFGVAGPVREDKVQVTNLPWIVDARMLSAELNDVPVFLLNDLEAIAYSIPTLVSEDIESIKPGERISKGTIAVIAPGTGLGEAFLFWDGHHYRPIPSEGGHTDFAPATSLELELLAYLQPRLNHVSYERVCSGLGIQNLYAFLRDSNKYGEPDWLRDELSAATDPTPIIFKCALEESIDICQATLELFLSILGSEAGNLVLQTLATGGVYLAGGIPPRIIPQLRGKQFLDAFARKGRLSNMLMSVPVDVIINSKAALFGAANHALLNADH
jgi:glucokinase